ncbi:MAG: serine/threonine protein kinase [Bryobacterales bacterium]|nr:serine/threonine protein kinase [Bryobacterales bacterium]
MTPELWKKVDDVLGRALELEGAARQEWIDRECGTDETLRREVLTLLKSDSEAQGFVVANVEAGLREFDEADTRTVRRAGPYRLTEELGRGGMGSVYLGERDDGQYQGQVAVKLVRPGMDTDFFLMRFKRERQALARLQHSHIARLLDSGTAEDGSPYIVMERVQGIPINSYVRDNDLSVRQILEIYLKVCAGVSHAHRHFIVHRDLKPGNILVEADGSPKLLDFGICKMLMGGGGPNDTGETSHMMTPDYASPEQVRGDPITISSDVYSLGAVLYELLSGARPHRIEKLTPQAVCKAVCEDTVIKPSDATADRTRARQLEGDLDTIVLKAMQKDADRRYISVEQFAEDLRRVIANEPVIARPDTAMYLAGKFVRRNRKSVLAASIAVLVLIGLSAAWARQAYTARQQAAEARRLANTMLFDVHDEILNLPGSLKARENIIRSGLGYLDRMAEQAPNDASLQADLAAAYLRIGDVQGAVSSSHTGDVDRALSSYRKGLASAARAARQRGAAITTLDLHHRIGHIFDTRDTTQALLHYDAGIEAGERLRRANPTDEGVGRALARLYGAKAITLRREEKRDAALEAGAKSIALLRDLTARFPQDLQLRSDLAGTSSNMGAVLRGMDRLAEARPLLEESARVWEQLCRERPSNTGFQRNRMLTFSHLGDLLGNPTMENLGDKEGARAAYQGMIAVAEQLYQQNPGDQKARTDFGIALGRVAAIPLETPEARLAMLAKAQALLQESLRRDPKNVVLTTNLGSQLGLQADLLSLSGRSAEAQARYREAMKVLTSQPAVANSRLLVGVLQRAAEDSLRQGRSADALASVNQAVRLSESAASAAGASLPLRLLPPLAYLNAAAVHEKLREPVEALRWRRKALDAYVPLSAEKGFPAPLRKTMDQLQSALAGGGK